MNRLWSDDNCDVGYAERKSTSKNRPSLPAKALQVTQIAGFLCAVLAVSGCDAANVGIKSDMRETTGKQNVQLENRPMWMNIGERRFAITLADTEASRAFAAMLPLTIDMADLNNNEKHAVLTKRLPTSAVRPGAIHDGDIMLYGEDTLVVFYLSFKSSYAYTRLGRVDDAAGLARALGSGGVRIHFSKQ